MRFHVVSKDLHCLFLSQSRPQRWKTWIYGNSLRGWKWRTWQSPCSVIILSNPDYTLAASEFARSHWHPKNWDVAWLRPQTVSALSLPCGLRVLERTVNFCLPTFFFFTDPVFLKLQKYKRELYFRNPLGTLIYMYTMWCKTVKKCARAKHQIERLKKKLRMTTILRDKTSPGCIFKFFVL